MTGWRSRGRADRQQLNALVNALTPRRRATLPVVIWRWRYEVALITGVVFLVTGFLRAFGEQWGIIGLSALIGAFSPPWPEPVIAWAWRIITPHRLRSGLAQARIQNASGRSPAIVRVSRAPFGERVLLWCPAGTSAGDVASARRILRASCWAADVRVTRDRQHAHLVTLDVVRRDDGSPVSAWRR